ncbi:MAG: phage tail tape measure protein [Acutalibacteraceae bacterium]
MANQEYDMLFKLSAQLDKAFGTTFGSAQKTMTETQNEIKALSQVQADISAYQKQQNAVDATSRKLEDYQAELQNIKREQAESGEYSSKLANAEIEMQRKIDTTSAKLENETAKLDAMQAELEEAGIDTDNLADEQKKLDKELDILAEDMKGFQNQGVSGFEAVGNALIAAGIAEGVKKITEAYKECVTISADFEQSVSQVAATMGVESSDVKELSEFAKQMGAETSFSAVQSSEGLNILAMAGLNATQQMEALPTVLDLAAAGNMDLATSAGFVTGVIKGFKDEMSNADYYADLMAKGATMANTNVTQLGEALSSSAATASSYNQTADSVTLTLLRLAEQNVVGSEAATKMNRAMADLYTPTDEAKKVLEELGVATYEANGDARDFNDVVDDLSGALENYSMEQQNAYKDTIFSMNGLQAFNKMTVSTSEKVNEFWTGLQQASGSAGKQAETQLDNLNGELTIFNSASEGLKITIGEQFMPVFTSAVNMATNALTVINAFAKQHPVVVKSLVAITAEMAAFTATYTTYQAAKKASAAISALKIKLNIEEKATQDALNASILANPYVIAAAGVAALTVGVIALANAEDEEVKELRTLTEASREEYNELQRLKTEYEEVSAAQGENSEQALYLSWQIDELTASYEASKQTMDEYISAHDELIDGINNEVNAARDSVEAAEMNGTKTLALIHRLQELAEQTDKTVGSQEEMKAIIAALNKEVPDLALNYEDVVNGVVDFGENLEAFVKAKADAEKYAAAQDAIVEAYKSRTEAEEQLTSDQDELVAAQKRLSEATNTYMETYGNSEGLGAIFALLTPQYKEMKAAQEAVDSLTVAVQEDQNAIDNANEAYNQSSEIITDFSEITNGATESERAMNEAIRRTTAEIDELTTEYIKAYDAAYESVMGQYDIWDKAAKVSTVSVSTINKNLESQATYWEKYNTNLQSLQDRTSDIEGLSEVIASFADGSSDSVNAIAGMAKASDADLKKMVENWKTVQEQEKSASEAIADLATDFSNTMNELQTQLKKDIEAMDLSEEAANNGIATIQGFIDGAENMLPTVEAMYKKLGDAAVNALKAEIEQATITAQIRVVGGVDNAYASGTDYAAAGYALVGEEGPELVKFNGGEKVYPAAETAAILDRNSVSVIVSPNITINGNASEETATVIVDEIIEQVKAALEEAEIDARRGAYV